MSKLTALALSIAVLGGVWAFLALNPLAGVALVWVGFIAWGCYFHTGGDGAALQKTIAGMSFGAVLAGIALYLVSSGTLGGLGALAAPLIIAVTVFPLVAVAGFNLLSTVPANVYGYAATAGLALTASTAGNVTAADFSNPVLLVIVSTVIGAIFGMLSGKLAGMLGK
ncbi:MAG: DUF1097 domain-containing protein [Methylotenera sp.]|jgi:hypothetical protein|nr:DUF1097 domain-containing protein [Methylotenera sp.]HOY86637.1 DUF1097 domain-containing protein [Methylotenera sp.]HPH08697.1 DUF1097 domain-containing protein [Methylotenera sp.]HPM48979.1 DUF1097 domain-containing protein [Methylotenera sp.]HPV32830.1 DUF1097 domain-containing protein [Methylotenera sp.]